MKRTIAFLLVLLTLCAASACAETPDFSRMTDDQLRAAYLALRMEAAARGLALGESLTLHEGRYIVGQDIDPGTYVITCVGTSTEDLSRSFGSLGAAMDGLDGTGGTSYSDLYASLGSAFAALDEGAKVEIIGDYGTVIKSTQLKKGQSVTITLDGKVALKITDGSCLLESK